MWSLLGLLWIHRRYEHKNIIHLFKFWFHSVYFKMQQISAPSHSFFFFSIFFSMMSSIYFLSDPHSFWVMSWWITAMKQPDKYRINRESHTLCKGKISMATLLKHSCLKMDLPSSSTALCCSWNYFYFSMVQGIKMSALSTEQRASQII